jgi:glycosyltransferase involved in cell wall biosynthesis
MKSERKKKIAMLVPRFGIVDRGVEIYTRGLVKMLEASYEITVYSRKKTKRYTRPVWAIAEENPLLQKMYNFHPKFKVFLDMVFLDPMSVEMLTFSIALFPRLLFSDYDLLYPQNGLWGAVMCRAVRLFRGIPFIYRSAGGKEPMIVRQKPNLYIATTPCIAKFIKTIREDVKVKVIPYPISSSHFLGNAKPKKIPLYKPIILCVGALIPAKRIDTAIEAVAKLKKGSLLVLGKGPLERDLKEKGRALLGPRRFMLKSVPFDEIAGYYLAAQAFTLPSYEEPFGRVYLEAMACNLPIVAPDDESRRYIIGKAGTYFRVGDLAGYARALSQAINADFGDKPLEQLKKFEWKRMIPKYRQSLDALMHR